MKRPGVLADHQAQTRELELIFIFYFFKREDDLLSTSILKKKKLVGDTSPAKVDLVEKSSN
jgi:hypothetical protein